LLNIPIEIRIRVEDNRATEIEEHGVVVKFMVGQLIDLGNDESASEYYLEIGKHEDDENESLEIQLTIGPNTQCITHGEQEVSEKGGDPVNCTRLLRTQKLEGLNSSVGCERALPNLHIDVVSQSYKNRIGYRYEDNSTFFSKQNLEDFR